MKFFFQQVCTRAPLLNNTVPAQPSCEEPPFNVHSPFLNSCLVNRLISTASFQNGLFTCICASAQHFCEQFFVNKFWLRYTSNFNSQVSTLQLFFYSMLYAVTLTVWIFVSNKNLSISLKLNFAFTRILKSLKNNCLPFSRSWCSRDMPSPCVTLDTPCLVIQSKKSLPLYDIGS